MRKPKQDEEDEQHELAVLCRDFFGSGDLYEAIRQF